MPAERVDRQREVSATARAQHFCLPVSLQGLLEPDAVKVASPVLRGPGAAMRPAYPTMHPCDTPERTHLNQAQALSAVS